MKILKDLEKVLNDLFAKLPPLPENIKKWFAEYAWFLAVVSIVLSGIAGILLLTSAILVSTVGSPAYVESLYAVQSAPVSRIVLFAWLALIAIAVNVIILLKAVPKLKLKARAGWELIFLSMVLWLVFDVLNWLQFTKDVGSFILSVVSTAVGFYVLFQIRDKFGSKNSSPVSE